MRHILGTIAVLSTALIGGSAIAQDYNKAFLLLADGGSIKGYTNTELLETVDAQKQIVSFPYYLVLMNPPLDSDLKYVESFYHGWCQTGEIQSQISKYYNSRKIELTKKGRRGKKTPFDGTPLAEARDMACEKFGY